MLSRSNVNHCQKKKVFMRSSALSADQETIWQAGGRLSKMYTTSLNYCAFCKDLDERSHDTSFRGAFCSHCHIYWHHFGAAPYLWFTRKADFMQNRDSSQTFRLPTPRLITKAYQRLNSGQWSHSYSSSGQTQGLDMKVGHKACMLLSCLWHHFYIWKDPKEPFK